MHRCTQIITSWLFSQKKSPILRYEVPGTPYGTKEAADGKKLPLMITAVTGCPGCALGLPVTNSLRPSFLFWPQTENVNRPRAHDGESSQIIRMSGKIPVVCTLRFTLVTTAPMGYLKYPIASHIT